MLIYIWDIYIPQRAGAYQLNQRTHVVIPQALVARIDMLVGRRGRSRFLVEAAAHELRRLSQLKTLRAAAGSWKSKDHPELNDGAAQWVKSLRSQDGKRRRKLTDR